MESKTKVRPFRKIIPIVALKNDFLTTKLAISLRNQIEIIDLDHILYLKSDRLGLNSEINPRLS
ncbi:hypothetical protein [Portibacter lacus]|uniref:Uncharacterized protein n=1 Tax=Portibacter lacus TaxID=1099794 RepID=A0AA37SJW2_9BACT|nr:hypothetical protein [Portibacter lacus]GLR15916.1 hypothetical protein GCM10007940_05310 [Portibacter lacus]